MLKKIPILIGLIGLSACANSLPQNPNPTPTHIQAANPTENAPSVQAASEVATQPESESLPYPKLDKQDQIDQLSIQINKLEQKVEQLQTRIRQLESRPATPSKQKSPAPRKAKPQIVQLNPTPEPNAPNTSNSTHNTDPLAAAKNLYDKNQYHAAIETLRGADGGGDGSINAQQQMYLLLQSHFKLNHCQSVIQIGRHFASRFSGSSNAPNALFVVGQCQWRIQQRDIAKDTWRDIIQRYPNSPVVKAAERAIQQK